MSKLLTTAALSTAILAGAAGADYSYDYFGSFRGERRVPNWQRINNFNPRPITHKHCRKNRMRKRY